MKPILMPCCTILPYEADHAAVLLLRAFIFNENPRMKRSSADSADILPFMLLSEASSVEILPFVLVHEADLAAILPFLLLHEADSVAI